MTQRETQAWADWELDILESWHALRGTAYVQQQLLARGVKRSDDSIRQKASRLGLSHAMRELTPVAEVAEEAGVTRQAVHQWLRENSFVGHCRRWGHAILMPTPAVSLYLHEKRASGRPRGWWGSAKTASVLQVDIRTVHNLIERGHLDAVVCGRTYFIDPHSAEEYRSRKRRPRPTDIKVRDVAASLGWTCLGVARNLRRRGIEPIDTAHKGEYDHLYITQAQARLFLDDMADGLRQKLQAVEAARESILK